MMSYDAHGNNEVPEELQDKKTRPPKPYRRAKINWLLIVIVIVGINAFQGFFKEDRPEVKAYKQQIQPLAAALGKAEKTGDVPTLIALTGPITDLLAKQNSMSDDEKEKLNGSDLRYCALAEYQLSVGLTETIETGHWVSKDKFDNALSACR